MSLRTGLWRCGFAVPLAVACTLGAASSASAATAYVANRGSGTVTPIELATNTPGSPITVGSEPVAVAITPNGKTAYVTNSHSNTVTPIELATNTPGSPITVGEDPSGIAITPNGKTAYVTNRLSGTVTPIKLANNTPGKRITVGKEPSGIAITPNGTTAYVTNLEGGVTPIETATNTPGKEITVGIAPSAVAITPDGKTAYVTNLGNAFGFGGGTVTPIEIATNTPLSEITVSHFVQPLPIGVAITPDGTTAYVTNLEHGVTPIEIATSKPGNELTVGSGPFGVAITPNGKTAYVTNELSGTVTPIETATNTPGKEITVGSFPVAIAIYPLPTTCTTNSGTVTLSPGLTGTAVFQRVQIKGTLTSCSGEAFTEAKYTATLTTESKASCSALSGPRAPAFGTAKYAWSPKTKGTTGTLSLPLIETAGIAFSSELETGPYSLSTLSGTVSETYTNAATCGVPQEGIIKPVTKGTFTGSAIAFE